MLSGYTGVHRVYHTCGRPPRNKEIGDTLFTSLPYNHMSYGLWLDKVCGKNPDPTGQVVVEVVTVGGARPVEYDTG